MRNLFSTLSLLLFFVLAQAQTEKPFVVSGTITGATEGTIFLKRAVNGALQGIDSVALAQGKFELKGTADGPEMFYLLLPDVKAPVTLFVDGDKLSVELDAATPEKAKVAGSPSHTLYQQYLDKMEPYSLRNKEIRTAFPIAQQANDTAKMKELSAQFDALYEEQSATVKRFVADNASSVVSAFLVQSMLVFSMEPEELEATLAAFTPEVKACKYGLQLSAHSEKLKSVAVGQVAPEFVLNDTTNTAIALSSFRGKVLLIDFWAAWCGPCRRENPSVVKMYAELKDRGFEILGVSLDRTKEAWVKAIHDDGITWPQVSDLKFWNCAPAQQYAVRSIPSTFLLDRNGVIVARNLRGEELKQKVIETLEKK